MVSEGWALELRGTALDLDDLREALQSPFDPWVEEYQHDGQPMLILRSNGWARLDSTYEIMQDARRLIDQINGAHLVVQADAEPISPGITLRFDSEGNGLPVIIAAVGQIKLSSLRARGRITTSPSGPAPPTPSPMQKMLARAAKEDAVADLLIFITRADNWFDIFKGMELIEDILGSEFEAMKLETHWKITKRTANWYRHAPGGKHKLPKTPPEISDARATLLRLVSQVL